MSEEYNVQAIIDDLKTKEEMDPNKHDGCYELMRKTIEAYAKMDDLSVLDFNDLNLVYLTTVGTFRQGLSAKIKLVKKSHLLIADKESLIMLWNNIWDKADQGGYGLDAAQHVLSCQMIESTVRVRIDSVLSVQQPREIIPKAATEASAKAISAPTTEHAEDQEENDPGRPVTTESPESVAVAIHRRYRHYHRIVVIRKSHFALLPPLSISGERPSSLL